MTSHLSPRAVARLVRDHDRRMDAEKTTMGLAKFTYASRFWEWVNQEGKDAVSTAYRMFDDRYEVNHIRRGINAYHAALFPHRMAAVVGRSAATTGDPDKASLLLNRWMFTAGQRNRFDTAIRQALLYPGVGFKVSYEPRRGVSEAALPPHQRVFCRVFPWWELVLDHMARDTDDARFYGHAYWKPAREVAEDYNLPLESLKTQRQKDFLDAAVGATATEATPATADGGRGGDADGYVRVLELCNLIDCAENNDYPGRFEVHLLDQGELSEAPIYVGEMPLWHPDGRPACHIVPLILEHHPEYPFQGIAPCRSWLEQQAELNAYRSQMATSSRRDKRVVLYNKNLGTEIIDKIASAREMEGIAIDPDKVGGDMQRAVTVLEVPPISVNLREHAAKAEQDLIAGFNLSPSAVGITQNVTASEIRYQRDFTDSEFGRYAAARERAFEKLAHLSLRATVAAMLDEGDMEGEGDDTLPAGEEGERPEESDEDRGRFPSPVANEEVPAGEPAPEAPVSPLDPYLEEAAAPPAAPAPEDDTEEELAEEASTGAEVIRLLDARKAEVEIAVEDIDSEFDVGFTETGRTPASDAEVKANLSTILPQYLQLFELVAQGGPKAAIALEAAKAYYTEYTLPENLAPDRLVAAMQEALSKAAPSAAPGAGPTAAAPAPEAAGSAPPPEALPPADAAAGPAPASPPDAGVILQQLVAAHGQNPEVAPMLRILVEQPPEVLAQLAPLLARIQQFPPDQQPAALQTLMQQLQGSTPPPALPA